MEESSCLGRELPSGHPALVFRQKPVLRGRFLLAEPGVRGEQSSPISPPRRSRILRLSIKIRLVTTADSALGAAAEFQLGNVGGQIVRIEGDRPVLAAPARHDDMRGAGVKEQAVADHGDSLCAQENVSGTQSLAAPGLEPDHNVGSGLAHRVRRVGMGFQRRPQPRYIGTLAEAQPGVSRAWTCAGAHANRRQHRESDLSHPVSFRLS